MRHVAIVCIVMEFRENGIQPTDAHIFGSQEIHLLSTPATIVEYTIQKIKCEGICICVRWMGYEWEFTEILCFCGCYTISSLCSFLSLSLAIFLHVFLFLTPAIAVIVFRFRTMDVYRRFATWSAYHFIMLLPNWLTKICHTEKGNPNTNTQISLIRLFSLCFHLLLFLHLLRLLLLLLYISLSQLSYIRANSRPRTTS